MAARLVSNGRYAEVAIGSTPIVIAYLYDWKVKMHTTHIPGEGYGDLWKYPLPVLSGWTMTIESYAAQGVTSLYLTNFFRKTATAPYFTVTGYTDAQALGTILFQGLCLVSEAEFLVPMGLKTQRADLVGYGPPVIGIT